MDEFARSEFDARLLCLGNDVLADDALGIHVAERFRSQMPPSIDVVSCMESGIRLIDYLLGVPRVVVIDTVQTGRVPPATILTFREEDVEFTAGTSAHYIGLFETLALGRKLGLPVARDVVIIAVEAADCRTLGAKMDPAVEGAIPEVIDRVQELLRQPCTSSESQARSSSR
jgi:hydrogenase maturation protease